jgi:hypothetical protein
MAIQQLLFAACLFALTHSSYAQHFQPVHSPDKATRSAAGAPPAFYLDSLRIDPNKYYFSAKDIAAVQVVKGFDSTLGAEGKVYISTKHPPMHFLSLGQVIAAQSQLQHSSPILFLIDGNTLIDTAGVRIETSLTTSVKVIPGASITYLNGQARYLALLTLSTKKDTIVNLR